MLDLSKSWKDAFIVQSNAIDPQPGYDGAKPGCQMYDNHLNALNFVLSDGWEINSSTPLDIHRFLTKGIDYFENHNSSGQYRTVDVWISNEECPKPYLFPGLIDTWFKTTKNLMNDESRNPIDTAWISHHMFEIIHPFIDGNGRTGRLIFNKVLHDLGEDARIIYYIDRHKYYDEIDEFRKYYWTGQSFCNLDLL